MDPADCPASPEAVRSKDCLSIRQSSIESDTGIATDNENSDDVNIVHTSESEEGDLDVDTTESCPLVSKSDSSYTVTCTVSIALAIPRGIEDVPVTTADTGKKLPKKVLSSVMMETHKPQAYYHIEYNLLPDSKELSKVDLVMFGLAAKVYTENETKVLKPWQEGDRVWLAWSQPVTLSVTRELLIKMLAHKITFRVWNTKDRVSAKARYDRPKVFRLPVGRSSEDPGESGAIQDCEAERSGSVKNLVYKLRAAYEKQNPKRRAAKNPSVEYKRSLQISCSTDVSTAQKVLTTETITTAPGQLQTSGGVTQETTQHSKQRYVHYGGVDIPGRTGIKSMDPEAIPEQVMGSSMKDKDLKASQKKPAQKSAQQNPAEMERMNRNGVASAELDAMNLLAGDRSVTECFVTSSGQVSAGLCGITLDQRLMSERLVADLNPLVITILSASSLPSTPVPYHVLQEKCLPVYCQYSFPNMPVRRTKGQRHSSNVYFRDVNVIFTGLLSPGELLQTLRGTALEVQVHDRDRKVEKPPTSPAIFGTEPDDDKLASAVLFTSKCTTHNPFREVEKPPEPHGVAKLSLSDLLRGRKCLNLSLPVRCFRPAPCPTGEKNERETNVPETAVTLDRPPGDSVPMGHYIDANTKLKVQVEIARPLDPELVKSGGHCPFGRIIYIFKYNNVPVLTKLRSEILRVNAEVFHLGSFPEETAQRVLCGHRMNSKERANQTLNLLTGFHMVDKTLHLFVLEGLKEQAIKKLWEMVPITLSEDAEKQVTVLYNSSLSFSERLYDTLDVGVTPVHLHEPLETIMREPLVYVRDMVPYACLQAILRISHLCQVKKLEDVVQNNLFPSAEMVFSLGQEFGMDPRRGLERLMGKNKDSKERSCLRASQRRAYTPLDNSNQQYLAWRRREANQGLYRKNFVQANIEEVQMASSVLKRPKPNLIVVEANDTRPAHNYSVQTMNSTIQAQDLQRKEMAKEPGCRFTYSQHYHSFTVPPVDVDAERKAAASRSRAAWRTCDGFVYPGFKSSAESNAHPKQPDEARAEELRKPWRENVLHQNLLRPTLNRFTRPWNQRHEDFELYVQPPFSPAAPVSIHLAGEALRQEQLQAARAQYARWLRKVLPDKNCPGNSRVPEFKCHMRRVGLDKLHDLLKDKPMKLSLKSRPVVPASQNTTSPRSEEPERGGRPRSAGTVRNHSPIFSSRAKPRQTGQRGECQFGCYWRPHSFQHRRAALPLTDEEERLHVFQKPLRTQAQRR